MVDQKPSTKRTYNSKRRRMQADQTRMLIVEAASKLFSERGYSGATMEAIAEESGVSVETVYAAFGNKREILSRLIDYSLVGDDKPVPLLQRTGPQSIKAEKDPQKQIALFARDIHEIMQRVAPVFEVMRFAAKTEPEIADLLQQILKNRLGGMQVFLSYLTENTSLQKGLTFSEATETVWAITSPEMFNLLINDRGWSSEQYEHWLAKILTRLLL